MNILRTAVACAILAVSFPRSATADQVVFSNLGPNSSYDLQRATFFGLGEEETDPATQSFSRAMPFMPVASGRLTTLELPLEFPWFTEPGWTGGALEVNLFEAAGGLPGRVLESFMSTSAHRPDTLSVFRSALQPELVAGMLYFLEARALGQTNGLWNLTLTDPTSPQADYRRTGNGPWQLGTRRFEAAFRVSAETDEAPVPEPATLLLVGGGLALALRQRHRSQTHVRR